MVPLFSEDSGVDRNVMFPVKWNYAKSVILNNIRTAREYRSNVYLANAKRNDFLQTLLLNFPVSFRLSDAEFVEQAKKNVLNFSQAVRMTSAISSGGPHSNNFINASSSAEFYLLVDDDSFEITQATPHWKELICCRYLDHESESLLPTPFCFHTNLSGVCVIEINAVKLMYCFKKFIEETKQIQVGYNDDRSIEMFVQKHVLPNMLISQLNISLFNRLVTLSKFRKTNTSKFSAKIPHPIVDIDNEVDAALKIVISNYPNTVGSFEAILQNTPSLFDENMLKTLILPNQAYTYNNVWLVTMARLKAFDFLVNVGGELGVSTSRFYLSRLKRLINVWSVTSVMRKQNVYKALEPYFSIIGKIEGLV